MTSRIKYMLFAVFICLPLSACSNKSTYDNVNTDIEELLGSDSHLISGSFFSSEQYLNWCNQVKWYAVPVILASILIGIGMMVVFKGVKKLKKIGLFGFVIVIPVVIFIVVYGMCFLYGKFY